MATTQKEVTATSTQYGGTPARNWALPLVGIITDTALGVFIIPEIVFLVLGIRRHKSRQGSYGWNMALMVVSGLTLAGYVLLYGVLVAGGLALSQASHDATVNTAPTVQTAPSSAPSQPAADPAKCTYAFNQTDEPQVLSGTDLKRLTFDLSVLRQHAISSHDANCLAVVYGPNSSAIDGDMKESSPSVFSFALTSISVPDSAAYNGGEYTFSYQVQTATTSQTQTFATRLVRQNGLWHFAYLNPVTH